MIFQAIRGLAGAALLGGGWWMALRHTPLAQLRPLLIITGCGALGGALNVIPAFHPGPGQARRLWYFQQPLIGGTLAFLFYACLRAFVVTTIPAESWGIVCVIVPLGFAAKPTLTLIDRTAGNAFRLSRQDARVDKLRDAIDPAASSTVLNLAWGRAVFILLFFAFPSFGAGLYLLNYRAGVRNMDNFTAGWIIIAVVVIVSVLTAVSARLWEGQAGEQSDKMSSGRTVFLALYFLSIGLLMSYLVVKLYTVEFKTLEPVKPNLSQKPPDTEPQIVAIVPDNIAIAAPPATVSIYGYNFAEKAGDNPKVQFNGEQRAHHVGADKELIVPLAPGDVSKPGSFAVTVAGAGNKTSAPKNLYVKAAADEKAPLSIFRIPITVTAETRLILLVLVMGALGAYVHSLSSLVDFIGNRQLTGSWFWWYVTRPFLGMSMALIFYLVIRGGFLAGTAADVKTVNPFGVVAIAALVGMFADKAGVKLSEVFETLFKTDAKRKDPLTALTITSKSPLPNATINTQYTHTLTASGGQAPYRWSATGLPAWLTLDPISGTLSGMAPAAPARLVTFNISVSDAAAASSHKDFTITVA